MKIVLYSTYHFLLESPKCPPTSFSSYYGISQTSKVELFRKKVNVCSRKQFSQNYFLLWWILLLPTINTSLKSIDLMQNTSPLFNNPLLHPTIKLRRIMTFKTGFRKLSILSKVWEWRIWQGVGRGVILFASLWRIAYKNWYVARPKDN